MSGDGSATVWALDPAVEFLNHGSFGACPRAVLEHRAELQARLARQPVAFFVREYGALLDASRERLAAFLGADPQGIVPVPNATSGVNAVLRSLELWPGDELLTTDHAYNACRNALEFVASRSGAKVVVARIPFPIDGPESAIEAVLERAGPRTRLALLDHVTSPTGLVLPLETLVARLAERGVDVLVDGAHGPGMLELELDRLGAAYYTGNCHKWVCAPQGAAFLHVRADRRRTIRPLTISHGTNTPRPGRSRFHDEFDWCGTVDPTAFFSIPAALDVVGALRPGGWPAVRRQNRELAIAGRRRLLARLETPPPCPESMLGALAALPIADGTGEGPAGALYDDPLQARLLERGIEVPIVPWPRPPQRLVRVSAHLYNRLEQYERLGDVLSLLLAARSGRRTRRPDHG